MKKILIAACVLGFVVPLSAQFTTPRVSQKATLSQTIGTTDISIEYHRPGVKDREIWGGLLPWDQPWRMGANEATTIEFSNDVMVEGQKLEAGKYSMFAIPRQGKWTVVINKDPNQWGAFGYDQEKDAMRLDIAPVRSDHTEWMRFTIDPTSPSTALITLEWDKIELPINVEVDVSGQVWGSLDQTLAGTYASAASWALDSGERLDDGLAWANRAIEMQGENVFNMWTKARLLHALGRDREAMPVITKVLEMAEGNVPAEFMGILQGTMRSIKDSM